MLLYFINNILFQSKNKLLAKSESNNDNRPITIEKAPDMHVNTVAGNFTVSF